MARMLNWLVQAALSSPFTLWLHALRFPSQRWVFSCFLRVEISFSSNMIIGPDIQITSQKQIFCKWICFWQDQRMLTEATSVQSLRTKEGLSESLTKINKKKIYFNIIRKKDCRGGMVLHWSRKHLETFRLYKKV